MKQKVLVTGGAGFIGTNLIKVLVDSGKYEVYSVDNYSTGTKNNHVEGATYFRLSLENIGSVSNYDIIIHLAARARIQPSFIEPIEYAKANIIGTLTLLDRIRIAKEVRGKDIKLIVAGSSSVYSGEFANPYTWTKDVTESICELYSQLFGIQSVVLRFFNVYGDHMIDGSSNFSTVLSKFQHDIKEYGYVTIYGTGEQARDFTHVLDICDGITLSIDNFEKIASEYVAYLDLGRGKCFTIYEIAKMFGISDDQIKYEPPKSGEADFTLAITDAAEESIGYFPTRNVEDYIKNNLI